MATQRLQVFYDGHCPICVAAMQRAAAADQRQAVQFINIAAADFDPQRYGASLAAMRRELHVLLPSQTLLVGIPAIHALYQATGRGWRTGWLTLPGIRRLAAPAYRCLAHHRYRLSRLLGRAPCQGTCRI